MTRLGILHPGEMGVSIAASAQNSGCEVYWASQGRSPATKARATEHGFHDAVNLENLCQHCKVIVCVCPPHAAASVAQEVIEAGFQGLYIEANAISPQRALQINNNMNLHGIQFVDGGIIGGPAWQPGETVLYLSGPDAQITANLFNSGPLATITLGEEPGLASALKLCYASYTKGTTALLCAMLATAEKLGVRQALYEQWQREGSDLAKTAERRLTHTTTKAWRFAGEMNEIADMYASAGLPEGFHRAAAAVYQRLLEYKDADPLPELEHVLEALLHG
jgi:3-hydroxyisobutyrate dehydrogenase-like beta-hydroxyacid dehydrogenase